LRKLAIPYTIRRQGIYHLNLRWGHQFLRHTLSTRDPLLALSKVNAMLPVLSADNRYDSIEVLRERLLEVLSSGQLSPTQTPRLPADNKPLLLSTAVHLYCSEKAAESWATRTLKQNQSTLRVLKEIVGDLELSAVTKAVARQYKQVLLTYPANRNKGLRKTKTIKALIQEECPPISIETIRNSMGRVSAFFNWCMAQGYVSENPFYGIAPKRSRSTRAERSPFSNDELGLIFGTPLYTQGVYKHDWQYWLPLLGLFTGARIEELCQLRGVDIKPEGGVYFFDIHGDGSPANRVKTACSVRRIPCHPALINLGLLKLKSRAGDSPLFSLRRINTNLSHKPSQWFSAYKTALGLPKSTKVFHSFRHTIRDALTASGVPAEHVREILGHDHPDETFGRYGSSIPVSILYKSLAGITFPRVQGHISIF